MSAKYSCADCLAFLGFERLFEREGGSIPDYSGMTDGPRTGKVCAPVPERQKPALRAKPGRESPRPTSGRRARWKQAKPGDRLKRRSTTGEPCGFLRTPVPRPLAALANPRQGVEGAQVPPLSRPAAALVEWPFQRFWSFSKPAFRT